MNISRMMLLAGALVVCAALAVQADSSGRIHGKLTTVDGDVFEGLIRWDKNEASWVDILNGNKELEKHARSQRKRYGHRDRAIEIFGVRVSGGSTWHFSGAAESGVRFGHIKTLEVIDDDAVLLILKSGLEIELEGGSTDIGDGIREIVIEDPREGEIEFVWDDIETIDFSPAPGSLTSDFGERLYGTVKTRRGDEFTGYICWDVDELFPVDVLDGEERRRTRKIKFELIEAIERYSSNAATVRMTDGDEMVLRGTNDVDDSNRGICVSDPNLGMVTVHWDEFESLVFSKAPRQVTYDEFDGGRPLEGTVYTEDGEAYTGFIRWDDDEEYTWEILDGDYRDVEFDIEFGMIKEIRRKGYSSSVVTLKDGRSFRLRDSNDIDEENKGIYIKEDDGDEIEIEWDEFERIEFSS